MSKKPFDTRPFHLKPFSLHHHRSTMKVGTDAMILGVWASLENVNSILDIGTGCGIISLLLASRSGACIEAIDIDVESVEEATENFRQSPFCERLSAKHADLVDFAKKPVKQFDLIISNPPFFINDMQPENEKRKRARHSVRLTYNQLCEGVRNLLLPGGSFYVVLPYNESRLLISIARRNGLFQKRQLLIFPREGMLPNRINIQFSPETVTETVSEKLIIRKTNNEFTQQYIVLLKDFYINLEG